MPLPFDLPEYPKAVDIGSPDVGHYRDVKVSLGLSLGEENAIKQHVKPFNDDYRKAFREVSLLVQKNAKGKDLLTVGKTVSKAISDGQSDALSLYLGSEDAQKQIEVLTEASEKRNEARMVAYALVTAKRKRSTDDFDPATVTAADVEAMPLGLKSQLSIFAQFESGGATLQHVNTATKTFFWENKSDDTPSSGFGAEEDEEALKNS